MDELYEVCEAAEESVEALWEVLDEPYPQRRMRQLIICIGWHWHSNAFELILWHFSTLLPIPSKCSAASLQKAISHRATSNISPSELFRSSETLRLSLNLATQWSESVALLTGRSWQQNALHQWEGEAIGMETFEQFRKRVDEVRRGIGGGKGERGEERGGREEGILRDKEGRGKGK